MDNPDYNADPLFLAQESSIITQSDAVKSPAITQQELQREVEELKYKVDQLTERVDKLEQKTDELSRLKFNGFFDVSISNYENQPNVFEIGDFELDIIHSYKENFQVAAALVFNQGAELRVGFIDYHLFGGIISPRGRLYEQKGLHIQVGKFDVPFGNDWQYFTAPERITVTPPLTTEIIMDGGYNDAGVRLLANFVSVNLSLYMLRGIEAGYSYGGNSYGGRIGLTPFKNPYRLKADKMEKFDLGFSYIHDIAKGGWTAEQVKAVDFESKLSVLFLQAEYYERDKKVGIIYNGYHVTGGIDFGEISSIPVKLYSRYDYTKSRRYEKSTEENPLSRYTGGLNIRLYTISYLKLEYQQYIETYPKYSDEEYFSQKLFYAQLLITF